MERFLSELNLSTIAKIVEDLTAASLDEDREDRAQIEQDLDMAIRILKDKLS